MLDLLVQSAVSSSSRCYSTCRDISVPLHHLFLPNQGTASTGLGWASRFLDICIALGEVTLLCMAQILPVPACPLQLEKAGAWF